MPINCNHNVKHETHRHFKISFFSSQCLPGIYCKFHLILLVWLGKCYRDMQRIIVYFIPFHCNTSVWLCSYCSFVGQKPQVNCSTNSSVNCTCHVSAYPFPTVRRVVNGNETINLDRHASSISIRKGDILFAYNTFGDDLFACPLAAVAPSTKQSTTTTLAATTVSSTTATTTTPSRLSTTQTTSKKSTSSAKSTSIKSTSGG